MNVQLGLTYRDRSGDRWKIVHRESGEHVSFRFLAERVDDRRHRNWYDEAGCWSKCGTTAVDLLRLA